MHPNGVSNMKLPKSEKDFEELMKGIKWNRIIPPLVSVEPKVLIPAQILFVVSAFRCLFPNRYTNNAVFHDSPLSSIFLTRFFATFSEVAYIYLFAYLIRLLNFNQVIWVNFLSWLMVFQVVISQFFVWCAILTGRLKLYFYEDTRFRRQ